MIIFKTNALLLATFWVTAFCECSPVFGFLPPDLKYNRVSLLSRQSCQLNSRVETSTWVKSNRNKNEELRTADQRADEANRRKLFSLSKTFAAMLWAGTVGSSKPALASNPKSRSDGYAVQKSDKDWRSDLSDVQYFVLRNGGTENPNFSILESEKRPGIFVCAGCGTELFDSKEKFNSGTGWPSFARGLDGVEVEAVNPIFANLLGVEVRCKTCGGHLGDVFNDGYLFVGTPAFVTGKRYCIDGAALIFRPANGDPKVSGDIPKSKNETPSWLEPPKIVPQ